MDQSIIRKAIDWCFPIGVWRTVAWNVLSMENLENPKKCESLQLITIKLIMSQNMRNGFYENVLFSLIFNEPVPSLTPHFVSLRIIVWPETFVQKWKRRLKFWKRKKKIVETPSPAAEIIQKLKEDHHVMFAILKKQPRIDIDFHMQVIIWKRYVKIKLKGDLITIVPHPDDEDYSVHWARQFLELGLSRGLWSVMVYFKGEGNYDHEYMRLFLNDLIDSLPRQIPEDGWRAEIEDRGRRNVYTRERDLVYDDEQTYSAQFVTTGRFDPEDLNLYWGYVV